MTYCVGVGEVPGISQPTTEMIVSASSSDVIHHQSTCCTSVVTSSYSSRGGEKGRKERGRGENYFLKHTFLAKQDTTNRDLLCLLPHPSPIT